MCPWEGAKKRRGSHILGSPLRSAGTERELQRLGGEHNPHLWQAEDPCTDWSAATLRASLRPVSAATAGPATQALSARSQKRTAAGCVDKA